MEPTTEIDSKTKKTTTNGSTPKTPKEHLWVVFDEGTVVG